MGKSMSIKNNPKKTVYDYTFYQQDGPGHIKAQVIKIAKDINAKNVLDIGAGSGWLVKALLAQNINAIGCDSSPISIKKGLVTKGEATKLPFLSNSFELVTAISLIEHLNISGAKKFLGEVKRVLRPSGYLFLITPNYASPLRFIQGKNWHGYLDSTHIKFYTPLSLRSFLKKNDFYNFKMTFPPPNPQYFDWILPRPIKKSPVQIKMLLNFLANTTPLTLLRNSFAILAQTRRNE